jgi:hypothetical protein
MRAASIMASRSRILRLRFTRKKCGAERTELETVVMRISKIIDSLHGLPMLPVAMTENSEIKAVCYKSSWSN